MTDEIKLKSITLDDFLDKNNIDTKKFNHWVIDVQGAEIDVFKGANKNLNFCDSITVEVSTENFMKKDQN